MAAPFRFKQFTVAQDRCAMKIGTDGVLLGAWTPVAATIDSILDIGAGTGVIALMLAQRTHAQVIDAVEIDSDAYEQAVDNFEASDWGDRLFCYHASFQEFFQEMDETYELLITNPPFYTEDYKAADTHRATARFEDALPFEHLLVGAVQLLAENGKLAMIIPYKEEEAVIGLAARVGLYPEKITRVRGHATAAIKRSLLLFGRAETPCVSDELIIEIARHQYTDAYIQLTKAYYLDM